MFSTFFDLECENDLQKPKKNGKNNSILLLMSGSSSKGLTCCCRDRIDTCICIRFHNYGIWPRSAIRERLDLIALPMLSIWHHDHRARHRITKLPHGTIHESMCNANDPHWSALSCSIQRESIAHLWKRQK